MDYKKTNAPTTTMTRNMADFVTETGNVYESIAIIGKRSNQIAGELKEELLKKLNEFSSRTSPFPSSTSRAHTSPYRNCSCSWNITPEASTATRHRRCSLPCTTSL